MISVIIPTYNRAGTIERAMKSVLEQTYTDLELIIVDDCSDDSTADVVASVKDQRVVYIRHELNKGACAARNTGISASRGDYIAFQDSDDIWYANKLRCQLSVLQDHCADVVFCKYRKIKDGKEAGMGPTRYTGGFLNPVVNLYGIGTQTLLGKREVFEKYNFDAEMPRFQEMELLLRISSAYSIYCMDVPLVDYEIGNADSISLNPLKLYKACILLLEKHPDLLKKYPDMGKSMSRRLLLEVGNLKKNDRMSADKMYLLSFKCDPSAKCLIKIGLSKMGLFELPFCGRNKKL